MGVAIQGNPNFANPYGYGPSTALFSNATVPIGGNVPPGGILKVSPSSASGSQKFGNAFVNPIVIGPSMHVGPRTFNPSGVVQHPAFLAGLMSQAPPSVPPLTAGSGAISTLVAQMLHSTWHHSNVGPIPPH